MLPALERVAIKAPLKAGGIGRQLAGRARRSFSHIPVMAHDICQLLRPQDGKVFIDMTFGSGGHSRRLLDTNKNIKIIAVDRDPVAIRRAQELAAEVDNKSAKFGLKQSVIPVHGKFSTVMRDIHLSGVPYGSVHGVLFDLGASSMQFDDPTRGFSINNDGPLDMRMDTSNDDDIKAEDVINSLSQENLSQLIRIYGEERRSRKLSNAIVDGRTLLGKIRTTHELAKVIRTATPDTKDALGRFAHGGTKLFQAIRIFVNNELNELNYGLQKVREFLIPKRVNSPGGDVEQEALIEPYGVAAVLTFHSLEDAIVKRHFTGVDTNAPNFKSISQHDRIRTSTANSVVEVEQLGRLKRWLPLAKHIEKPSDEEIAANPRSRSAKLRVAVRIDPVHD